VVLLPWAAQACGDRRIDIEEVSSAALLECASCDGQLESLSQIDLLRFAIADYGHKYLLILWEEIIITALAVIE